jgi:hypothetical protein
MLDRRGKEKVPAKKNRSIVWAGSPFSESEAGKARYYIIKFELPYF